MEFREYRFYILSDLYRTSGDLELSSFVRNIILGESYRYIFWMRTCLFLNENIFLRYNLFQMARFILREISFQLGISIAYKTKIGSGFYIGHFGCIIISGNCKIRNNCNISQGVTIGGSNRGKSKGYPIIGDNVYVGPGAKIFGAIKTVNNVAIGASYVETKDIPDNAVVIGIHEKVISFKGLKDYIN